MPKKSPATCSYHVLFFCSRCLESIRPYHGLLLLVDPHDLFESSPPDSSPALLRLIQVYSPLKSFQTLAADADITLTHVFQLTGHMVYWAQAMVIYPVCENNIYVVAPNAPTHANSPLLEHFSEKFPGESLLQVSQTSIAYPQHMTQYLFYLQLMSDFSLPTSLSQKLSPLVPQSERRQLTQIIAWMLQHRLLFQLHTYIHLMPGPEGHPVNSEKLAARNATEKPLSRTWSASDMNGKSSGKPCKIKNEVLNMKSVSHQSQGLYGSLHATKLIYPFRFQLMDAFGADDKESVLKKLLLNHFSQDEREAILRVSAASNLDDLFLLINLYDKGYLSGKHHLEEIMYSMNIKRCQLLQILDKFRDVLITSEMEDPAISIFYSLYDS
ncbi:hypothetical protein RUM44_014024 [Polyplax serrata]|uniref:GATOR complex protein NPRL3 n=1 Tax=Polyplax serrata TaxID=468196 RepID=A0ABR1BFV1_POLSC